MKTIMCSLDVSTNKTGFAVFENGKRKYSMLLDNSKISSVETRSMEMAKDILFELEKYKPTIIAIEDTYCGGNVSTMKKLNRLQGCIWGWCVLNGADFNIYLPSSWRKEFGDLFKGKKRDECKKLAVEYIKNNYKLDVNDDEAEAIMLGEATVIKYNR